MKVISIKQPYASLIAYGIKKYEFRTWKTNYRGEVLIHASKSLDEKAVEEFNVYDLDMPFGFIIAKATISDVILVDDEFKEVLRLENSLIYNHIINDKNFKGYAFKLDNVQLVQRVFVKGKLGLWNYE